jgi:hypothetical protein
MLRLVGGVNRAAAANKKLASRGVTQASAPRNHPVEDDWRDVGKSVGSVNDLREASTAANAAGTRRELPHAPTRAPAPFISPRVASGHR